MSTSLIIWPLDLPQAGLVDGTSETFAELAVRFQTDTGPAQVRRRSSTNTRSISMRMFLTPAQYALLEEFWHETIGGGAEPFAWVHPITGDSVDYRMVAPPQLEMVTPRTGPAQKLSVSLSLEIIPTTTLTPEVISTPPIWELDLRGQHPPTPLELALLRDAGGGGSVGYRSIEPGVVGDSGMLPVDPIDGGDGGIDAGGGCGAGQLGYELSIPPC